jgi:hypothetical protein
VYGNNEALRFFCSVRHKRHQRLPYADEEPIIADAACKKDVHVFGNAF